MHYICDLDLDFIAKIGFFQTQVSLTHFTWQTNFGFYSIKIQLEIAEMSVGEKTTKPSPNQTKPT